MNKRKYTKTRRAEQEDETRNKIVEALVALHEEVGPAHSSIKAIAEKAGVQRLTVYRHFPDDASLFEACTSHYLASHPPPGITDWADIDNARERSYQALMAFYKYYRQTEKMWHKAYRDVDQVEVLQGPINQFEAHLDQVTEDLLKAWNNSHNTKKHLQITLRHALRFATWQSLNNAKLKDEKMAELVGTWLRCIAS